MCPETESLEGLGNSSKATRCNSRAGLCLLLSDHKIGTVGEWPLLADSVEKLENRGASKIAQSRMLANSATARPYRMDKSASNYLHGRSGSQLKGDLFGVIGIIVAYKF
jgi:hypothetical protein